MVYEEITPVNTFRVIFNCLFGSDFKLLKDRIFWSDHNAALDLQELTVKLKGHEGFD